MPAGLSTPHQRPALQAPGPLQRAQPWRKTSDQDFYQPGEGSWQTASCSQATIGSADSILALTRLVAPVSTCDETGQQRHGAPQLEKSGRLGEFRGASGTPATPHLNIWETSRSSKLYPPFHACLFLSLVSAGYLAYQRAMAGAASPTSWARKPTTDFLSNLLHKEDIILLLGTLAYFPALLFLKSWIDILRGHQESSKTQISLLESNRSQLLLHQSALICATRGQQGAGALQPRALSSPNRVRTVTAVNWSSQYSLQARPCPEDLTTSSH